MNMFSNLTPRSGGRSSGSSGKTAAFYDAVAIDAVLGGALDRFNVPASIKKSVSLFEAVCFERSWTNGNLSADAGRDGMFQYSCREVSSKRSRARTGKGVPDNMDQRIRDAWAFLKEVAEGDAELPAWCRMQLGFWNQKTASGGYDPECPNPTRADCVDAKGRTLTAADIESREADTCCWVNVFEETDDEDAAREFILNNLTDEPPTMADYKF
jgi:hypothetical protein